MKNKIKLVLPVIILIGGFAISANSVLAFSNAQQLPKNNNHLQIQAEVLGVSVDDLQSKLNSGETMKSIVESAGYTAQTFRDAVQVKRLEKFKTHLDKMVSEGKITQEQADKRYKAAVEMESWMEERQEKIFSAKAEVLGMTTDELKSKLDSGSKMKDLISDTGLSQEELQSKMNEKINQIEKDHLEELVSEGIITQEQADKILKNVEIHHGKPAIKKHRHPAGKIGGHVRF